MTVNSLAVIARVLLPAAMWELTLTRRLRRRNPERAHESRRVQARSRSQRPPLARLLRESVERVRERLVGLGLGDRFERDAQAWRGARLGGDAESGLALIVEPAAQGGSCPNPRGWFEGWIFGHAPEDVRRNGAGAIPRSARERPEVAHPCVRGAAMRRQHERGIGISSGQLERRTRVRDSLEDSWSFRATAQLDPFAGAQDENDAAPLREKRVFNVA